MLSWAGRQTSLGAQQGLWGPSDRRWRPLLFRVEWREGCREAPKPMAKGPWSPTRPGRGGTWGHLGGEPNGEDSD